ncbi:MAG TPA: MFS transporter [Candidatus Aminicenantes bacterium]|nr:MFS transporter [Candidatus Aminicenantes bacterium]HRY65544.1 MFS transporter [Candidatus Aminicenantes bacterium]HRZ72568.1 MFS transporter [Candidatus Aminicenantes bacterium]
MPEPAFTETGAAAPAETRRTLRTFAVASFLNDMGSDIINPVWPLFVTQVLKANMAALGFLDGLGEAIVSLSQAVAGYYSDKIRKRKVFIWSGYLCGAVSRLGYAASSVWQHLIPFRVLDRAGKIRGAPRDAMLADISTDANRGRHFGLLRAMDNSGSVAGILISIALFGVLGYRLLFALAAVPSLVSVFLVLRNIREKRSPAARIFKGLSFRDIDRNLALYILLNAVFALGAFTYSFLLVYARSEGFRTGAIPVLFLVYSAVAALLSYPFGRLSDRIGRKPVLFLALGAWAVVCAGVVFARGPAAVATMFVLYGLHKAALDPVQKTIAAELAPDAYRASVLGGFQMVIGVCAFPASMAAGFLWDKAGRRAPFLLSMGLTAIAALLLVFVKDKRRRLV